MALQSSGAISISDIKTELGSTSNSLRTLSSTVGFTTPDSMSEFYGYSAAVEPTENFEVMTYSGSGSSLTLDSKVGKAADFNGTNSYIQVFDSTALRLTGGSYTLSFWFKAKAVAGPQRLINKDDGNDFSAGYSVLLYGDGSIGWTHNDGSNNQNWNFGNYSANTWYHLCLVYDDAGNQRRAYINNSLNSSRTTNTNLAGGNDVLQFGQIPFYGQRFKGLLNEIRFYNKALSTSEISTLYNESNSSTISISNLVAHWKLDNNANEEGNNYNGTAYNIGYGGSKFQPDLVWIKTRTNTGWHNVADAVRGASKQLYTNSTSNETSVTNELTTFNSNGFTVGNSTNVNGSSENYVAWCWKAGNGTSSNTNGSTTSTVSANQAAGFSIVSYTGTSANASVGHGLSSAPEMIIAKHRNWPQNWAVYHKDIGNNYWLQLNTTGARIQEAIWQNTTPSSSVFYMNGNTVINRNGYNSIAYCFHSVSGYQKIGSYTGNGSSTNSITTGFQPRFLIVKCSSQGNSYQGWFIHDSGRTISGGYTNGLNANNHNTEFSNTATPTFNSNGFTINTSGGEYNAYNQTYIYLAIA